MGQGEAAPFGCPSRASGDGGYQHNAEAKSKSGREGEDCDQDLPKREVLLEEDPGTVTETFDPKHVECIACGHRIGQEKRRLYHPGLWFKHKERCTGIDQRFVRVDIMVSYLFIAKVIVVLLTSASPWGGSFGL
jgi:hypothetical protein